MPQEIVSYCPQCLLVVFAAMGFYQYVMRDRILNGSDAAQDEYLDIDIDEMDESTQRMLLEVLTNDHINNRTQAFEVDVRHEARSA